MTGDVREAITGVAGVSTVHVLIITPVIFFMKRRALRRGRLRPSTMTSAPS